MIKPLLIFVFLFQLISTNVTTQTTNKIEIFDISKGKVIMNVQVNTDLQQDVEKFLSGIKGVYVKFDPIPNKGLMVKIPLDPTVMVNNQWFNDFVDEVIIILPGQENPYLLVFDDENNPHFFTFKGDTDTFIAKLNIRL